MEFDISFFKDFFLTYAPKALLALTTFALGLWTTGILLGIVDNILKKSRFARSLQPFVVGIVGIILKTLLGINVLGILGFETTSFIALLGSAGLAIGMSLSGTVNNLAGGIVLLNTNNFKPGDLIEAQGHKGFVREIQIFNTILTTPDNKTVSIANGALASGSVVNHYKQPTRRIDLKVSVDYNNSLDTVKNVLMEVVNTEKRILKEPHDLVTISELADTHVQMLIRVWVRSSDYWDTIFALNEAVKKAFEKETITCHNCPHNWYKQS